MYGFVVDKVVQYKGGFMAFDYPQPAGPKQKAPPKQPFGKGKRK